ncbi:metallophosphoesterase [Micrococcales bacterium 31B]|nr:metallophosphoesterase [Micrococcales bacterium 31B]
MGASALAYARFEAESFTLRHVEVPVLPPGARPLRLLHLSDIHLLPQQAKKQDWIRALAELEPDLVINTGDNISASDAIEPALAALGPLLGMPGAFVMGSNDYFVPRPKNPLRYLRKDPRVPFVRQHTVDVRHPVSALIEGLESGGWLNLTNTRGALQVEGLRLDFAGVDDPHLDYDRYPEAPAQPTSDAGPTLKIGVAHAPYQRVLNEMIGDQRDLIIAGHTHGGQLCIPGYGALTTNCDLDTRRAKGLSMWPADAKLPPRGVRAANGTAYLHVSAGLGTSPYAQVRFACRPEATLLRLTTRPLAT